MMSSHLTDAEVEGYAKRALAPDALLAADDHIVACAPCRGRAAAVADLPGGLASLRDALADGAHLSDDQVQELAGGGPTAGAVAAHLRACPTCARAVEDLRAWARRRSAPRRSFLYAAAAAVLLTVALPTVLWRSSRPAPTASLAGLESLRPEERAGVQAALQQGAAEPPALLSGLAGGRETLMGAGAEGAFQLVEPLATIVRSDRPTFRWAPLPGADGYAVAVLDDALRPVAKSPPLSETAWTPQVALPRGATYVWQVTARRAGRSITAPAPPAPLARFGVLEESAARRLEEIARDHPGSHLLLGILYAQAGARAEAEEHLGRVGATDPNAAVAQRTLDRLKRVVEPKAP
jgi:hypothetical protein